MFHFFLCISILSFSCHIQDHFTTIFWLSLLKKSVLKCLNCQSTQLLQVFKYSNVLQVPERLKCPRAQVPQVPKCLKCPSTLCVQVPSSTLVSQYLSDLSAQVLLTFLPRASVPFKYLKCRNPQSV